jgi:hypothetical protein
MDVGFSPEFPAINRSRGGQAKMQLCSPREIQQGIFASFLTGCDRSGCAGSMPSGRDEFAEISDDTGWWTRYYDWNAATLHVRSISPAGDRAPIRNFDGGD